MENDGRLLDNEKVEVGMKRNVNQFENNATTTFTAAELMSEIEQVQTYRAQTDENFKSYISHWEEKTKELLLSSLQILKNRHNDEVGILDAAVTTLRSQLQTLTQVYTHTQLLIFTHYYRKKKNLIYNENMPKRSSLLLMTHYNGSTMNPLRDHHSHKLKMRVRLQLKDIYDDRQQ